MHRPPLYTPLHIIPSYSPRLGVGWAVVNALALLVIAGSPLPGWGRLALGGALAIQAWREMTVHILRSSSRAILEALWDGQGDWTLHVASGTWCPAELERDSLVTLPLVVLNFHARPRRRCSLILTTDNCDPELLRRLRVRLRLEYGRPPQKLDPGC